MRFDDPRTEWRINDIERQLNSKQDKHETTSADRNVANLEHTVRELSSVVDGLRYELQTLQEEVSRLREE